MTTQFWTNDLTILFNKEEIYQVWPTKQLSFNAKLNAISRLIIIMTILGFILTKKWNILIIGIVTLSIIYALYKLKKQQTADFLIKKEGFSVQEPSNLKDPVTLKSILRSNFHPTNKKNPFGNVLLTDINDTPERLSAAPSFNPDVYEDIDRAVKKQTQMLNPGIINTNKQIYGDLKDNYDLDNSMMQFYSMPNTRVANDQGAYANWLYANMPSGKSSGPDGAFARVQDNWQWINP